MTDKRIKICNIKICKMISDDMKNDASEFEGKEFNGRNVAEYLGNLGAAVAALANILSTIIEDTTPATEPESDDQSP